MTTNNDILEDQARTEIREILDNAQDWYDAIMQLQECSIRVDDKKINTIVNNYFFGKQDEFAHS